MHATVEAFWRGFMRGMVKGAIFCAAFGLLVMLAGCVASRVWR